MLLLAKAKVVAPTAGGWVATGQLAPPSVVSRILPSATAPWVALPKRTSGLNTVALKPTPNDCPPSVLRKKPLRYDATKVRASAYATLVQHTPLSPASVGVHVAPLSAVNSRPFAPATTPRPPPPKATVRSLATVPLITGAQLWPPSTLRKMVPPSGTCQ